MKEEKDTSDIVDNDKKNSLPENKDQESDNNINKATGNSTLKKVAIGVTAGVAVAATAPVAVGALGFTGAGVAGSIAAKVMSASAVYGYGGAIVGGLQSIGAAGLSASTYVAAGSVGGLAGLLKRRQSQTNESKDAPEHGSDGITSTDESKKSVTTPDTKSKEALSSLRTAGISAGSTAYGYGRSIACGLKSVGARGISITTDISAKGFTGLKTVLKRPQENKNKDGNGSDEITTEPSSASCTDIQSKDVVVSPDAVSFSSNSGSVTIESKQSIKESGKPKL